MSTKEFFWCLSGKVESDYLIHSGGEPLKIRSGLGDGEGLWKCVPSTNTTGVVSSISILEKLSQPQPSFCVGRVTQISKRGLVLVKVSLSRKIMFCTTSILHISGLYRLEFEFLSGQMHITSSTRLDEIDTRIKPSQTEKASLTSNNCCGSCHFFHNRCCESSDSPLFTLMVDPTGVCACFDKKHL